MKVKNRLITMAVACIGIPAQAIGMKTIFLAGLVAASTAAMATIASAQSTDDFVFENDTNSSVTHLYVSPHGQSQWGSDVLGRSILGPNRYTTVYWPEEPAYDIYDIRVDFNGAHYNYQEGYDLSTISKIWVTCPRDGVVDLNWR
jgi:hypothetical protein